MVAKSPRHMNCIFLKMYWSLGNGQQRSKGQECTFSPISAELLALTPLYLADLVVSQQGLLSCVFSLASGQGQMVSRGQMVKNVLFQNISGTINIRVFTFQMDLHCILTLTSGDLDLLFEVTDTVIIIQCTICTTKIRFKIR